jgi:hypothetical protein
VSNALDALMARWYQKRLAAFRDEMSEEMDAILGSSDPEGLLSGEAVLEEVDEDDEVDVFLAEQAPELWADLRASEPVISPEFAHALLEALPENMSWAEVQARYFATEPTSPLEKEARAEFLRGLGDTTDRAGLGATARRKDQERITGSAKPKTYDELRRSLETPSALSAEVRKAVMEGQG